LYDTYRPNTITASHQHNHTTIASVLNPPIIDNRLAILYRILNLLIHFSPVSKCALPPEFLFAPLPGKRKLWEARDEDAWRAEMTRDLHHHRAAGESLDFGLVKGSGQIVRVEEGRLSCWDGWVEGAGRGGRGEGATTTTTTSEGEVNTAAAAELWEEWCTGIDGFGGLVMLAASLIL
jgi:hypothetical protein